MSARDPVDAAHTLIERLALLVMECPTDGIWPGYKLTEQSRDECTRAIALLNEARQIFERCISREEPRAEPFYQAFAQEERREWTAQRGEPAPLS